VTNFNKGLAVIFSLLLATIGLVVVFMALGWTTPLDYLNRAFNSDNSRWIIGITAAVIFFLALNLIYVNLAGRPITHTRVSSNEMGEINITLPAVETLVKKAALQIKGVRDVKPAIKCTPNGIAVFLRTSMQPGTIIPQSGGELQTKVKSFLEQTAGLDIVEVKVLITNVNQEGKGRVD